MGRLLCASAQVGWVSLGRRSNNSGMTPALPLHLTFVVNWTCRRALLLACCSSQHTAAWVLAVPTVKQQLLQQQLALGGPLEAHGALWQLLLHSASSQPAKAATSNKPAAVQHPATTVGEDAQQQLLSLLQLQSGNMQQLQRQVVTLQLMVDAQKAAGSRQRLWVDVVSDGTEHACCRCSFFVLLYGQAGWDCGCCGVMPPFQSWCRLDPGQCHQPVHV